MFEDVEIVILDTSATTQKTPNTIWWKTTYALFSSRHLKRHCVNQQRHILISCTSEWFYCHPHTLSCAVIHCPS